MKTLKSICSIFVCTLAFISFTSCDVEPIDSAIDVSTGGGSGTTIPTFKAKVNGVDFMAASDGIIGDFSTSAIGNELNIVGLSSNGKSITIQLINPSIGTFEASYNVSNLNILQYFDSSLGTNGTFISYNQTSDTSDGTVTITHFDRTTNKVSGTFSFTGFNPIDSSTKQITNGVFNNIPFENTVD